MLSQGNLQFFYKEADLTCTIKYDFSKPQWQVGLGAGLGVSHLFKFIRIANS